MAARAGRSATEQRAHDDIGEEIDNEVENDAVDMRDRLLDPVAPGQGSVHGIDHEGHTKPGEHGGKSPIGRGEERGKTQSCPQAVKQ